MTIADMVYKQVKLLPPIRSPREVLDFVGFPS